MSNWRAYHIHTYLVIYIVCDIQLSSLAGLAGMDGHIPNGGDGLGPGFFGSNQRHQMAPSPYSQSPFHPGETLSLFCQLLKLLVLGSLLGSVEGGKQYLSAHFVHISHFQ